MMMPGAGLIVPFPAIEFYLWAILLAWHMQNAVTIILSTAPRVVLKGHLTLMILLQ